MSDTKTQYRDVRQNIPQIEKFREAAREHETDDSEERFDRIVKGVAKPPPQKDAKKDK